MLKKHFWKIAALIALLVLGGAVYYSKQASKNANEGVVVTAHIKGNVAAKVELIEYSDFQCPACSQFAPYVKELMDEYAAEIRFEYRHFPLITIHPQAIPAARAAEAASQQGKFWEMHDKLFENQNTWSKSSNPNALFVQYAEELGLNITLFKTHLDSSLIADAIDKSFEDARTRGFAGTPTFLLNGEQMEFTTFEEFRGAIDAAVEAANAS
ncbi:hypothetical protein A2392_03105 [Candidatus Kaiserbacteria bacterium RIFOXYB1_FULL_46_14]|uniref:Thioredoxin domain-containing protein n=1 Tax=Candidatus Kaiserbacteria bacterium RIFOXYB1_FULL_46_14 TaxID=1798531 RepID=A0A1F6FIS0_9BACT|nr:MAG: hypothetical protein A2392_03105 [Candidatus Kaiserbacteria bacterium RIFOXYB1_FULL_46_14]